MCYSRCKYESRDGECMLDPSCNVLPCLFDEEDEDLNNENWEERWK